MGYHRAGFDEIVGVDIKPQPRYPFQFVQGDALEYVAEHGHEFDAIHASPPCQGYSRTQKLQGNDHPMLIEDTRKLLQATGKPYVIENVKGAPLKDATLLVGSMFGLMTMRPRLFETNFPLPPVLAPPPHARHAEMGRKPKPGEYVHVVGHVTDVAYCRDAMGIDWMIRDELAEAIPPAYTEWIGRHLIEHIRERVT
jgi:DNA (cytosine-5)-methyltransferase 1